MIQLENTLKENCDIKVQFEPMDPENAGAQTDRDLENTRLDGIKVEYINEGYSDVKVGEYSIDTTLDLLKAEYINESYSDVKSEEHTIGEDDTCHSRDNEEHFGDNHVKDEEISDTHIISCSTHIREDLYPCNMCSKNFDTHIQLVRHLKTHTTVKNLSCNHCGKSFSQRNSLITHMTTHAGVKNHSCNQCGKSFNLRCTLIKHMTTHTGDKNHSCNQCGKSFSHRHL